MPGMRTWQALSVLTRLIIRDIHYLEMLAFFVSSHLRNARFIHYKMVELLLNRAFA
jgi:hypothetical protein